MSPRYRILCYLIIVKKVFLVALVITHSHTYNRTQSLMHALTHTHTHTPHTRIQYMSTACKVPATLPYYTRVLVISEGTRALSAHSSFVGRTNNSSR